MIEIIGVENVDYVSKSSGNRVKGVRVYASKDLMSPSVGVSVQVEFIPGASVTDFPLGPAVSFAYEKLFNNSYRCTGIVPLVTNSKGG